MSKCACDYCPYRLGCDDLCEKYFDYFYEFDDDDGECEDDE